jgi:heat shock protein HslJ
MRDSFSRGAMFAFALLALFGLEEGDAQPQTRRDSGLPFAEILVGSIFIAQGNEPAWTLTFSKSRLLFVTELGRRQQTWLLPLNATSAGGQSFHSNDNSATLTVNRLICRDTMTGMPYPAVVLFSAEGKSWKGCGGNPLALLTGKTWRIIAMNDKALQESTSIWLTIRPTGDVNGSTGCFRFRSTLMANGEGIRFKPMNTTWPSCIPASMHQAYQFITKLSNVRRFDLDENGTLSLFGDGQSILKALPLPTGG